MTSASYENKTSSKDDIIIELMEACKEFDEVIRVSSARKLKFENLINELLKDNSLDDSVGTEEGDYDNEGSF